MHAALLLVRLWNPAFGLGCLMAATQAFPALFNITGRMPDNTSSCLVHSLLLCVHLLGCSACSDMPMLPRLGRFFLLRCCACCCLFGPILFSHLLGCSVNFKSMSLCLKTCIHFYKKFPYKKVEWEWNIVSSQFRRLYNTCALAIKLGF